MLKVSLFLVRRLSARNRNHCTPVIDVIFGKYLFVTNTFSSGVLMLIGDLIDQELHYDCKKSKSRYDYERLARMFLTGLSMGPVHHYYYRYINVLWPIRDLKSISKKVLSDQIVMGPLCIVQFFYTLGFLERKTIRDMNEEVKQKFPTVYMFDWCIWPPTQFLNFYLVPCRYQVFYINFVTMLYNVFLSFMKHEV